MKKRNQRFLSLLLSLLMLLSLLPTAAFAAVRDGDAVPVAAPATAEDGKTSPATPAVVEEVPAAEDDTPAKLSAVTNIAQGKTATASFELDSNGTLFSASNLVDNDTATRWCGHWDKTATETIVIDLDSPATVQNFVFHWAQSTWANQLVIKTAATDSGWDSATTVFSQTYSADPTADSVQTITPTSTSLQRYVRFELVGNGTTGTHDSLAVSELEINGELDPLAGNLCRPSDGATVTATASSQEADSVRASNAIDGNTTSSSSRWGSAVGDGPHSIQIDLGALRTVSMVKIFWERLNILAYTLEGSTDGENWTPLYTCSSEITTVNEILTFAPVSIQYLKLNITSHKSTGLKGDGTESVNYNTVSLFEIEAYRDSLTLPETPDGNLCRPSDGATVTATVGDVENGTIFTGDKVIDGNQTTRWSTNKDVAEPSVVIDLGKQRSISSVVSYWCGEGQSAVSGYTISVSDSATGPWTVVKTYSGTVVAVRGDNAEHTPIYDNFDSVTARYIKLQSTGYRSDAGWKSMALWEVEVYRDHQEPSIDASSVLTGLNLTADSFEIADGKLKLKDSVNVPEDFTITFAANLEQVVGADGTIYTPVVDKEVAIDVTVTDAEGASATTPANSPIRITIPGAHAAAENEGGNPKPAVIPEIMEWYSHGTASGYLSQSYTLPANGQVRILYRFAFADVAKELQADLKDLYGIEATLERLKDSAYATLQNIVQNGDIVLFDVDPTNANEDNRNRVQGYDDETYGMEVYGGKVYIYATHPTGAYWGTRTLLQGMQLSEDGRSFPNGTLRDYPEFKVRGFILDVGRKPMSMQKLQEIAKNMAWYKMNDLHIHLNDNLIFMEDYKDGQDWWANNDAAYKRANQAYSAFRLESSLTEEADAVAPLAARDYHYTKAEYKSFVENSAKVGVTIVSEIDVPAHAKAITDAFPSIRLRGAGGHPYNDHLNLSTEAGYTASLALVKAIFDDYIDSGVFGSSVHFGADEYYDSHPAYRRFVKDMIDYLNTKANLTTKRVWGSLSSMNGNPTQYPTSDIAAEGIQMNIWSTGWADPQAMYDLGFDLINCLDGGNYMVPDSGYYHASGLGHGKYSWNPNEFGDTWIPASSSQMLGGAYAIWNDSIDTRANGVDEQGVFHYFFDSLPYYACALWGRGSMTQAQVEEKVAILDTAPRTNPKNTISLEEGTAQYFRYNFTDAGDRSGNGRDLTLQNATVQSGVLSLSGGASYAEIGLDRLAWDSKLSFKVKKLATGGSEQIIFEGDHAYGEFAIKAIPVEGDDTKWRLGFSRELYNYVYEDVDLPVGDWVTLELVNEQYVTTLYVNGDEGHAATGYFLPDVNSNTPFRGVTFVTGQYYNKSTKTFTDASQLPSDQTPGGSIIATSYLATPIARIGSKTNSFKGLVDDVYASPSGASSSPVADGKYDIPVEQYAGAQDGNHHSGDGANNAIDGNAGSVWHTEWNFLCPVEDNWIQIQLNDKQPVAGFRYLPRPTGTNGTVKQFDILVSDDGEHWTTHLEGGAFSGTSGWQSVSFPAVEATYVRLHIKDSYADSSSHRFGSAAEIRVTRPIRWGEDGNVSATLDETSYVLTDGKAEPLPLVIFDGTVLVKDTDYTVTYQNNTAAGTATVTVTPAGVYLGDPVELTFTVTAPPSKTDLSTATVTFAQSSYPLEDGKAEPDPIVKVGNTTLLRGLDYDVTYENNTAVGAATATITGLGDYTGEKTATFTVTPAIVKKNLSDTAKTKVILTETTFPYDGVAIKPEPVVTYDGETLVKGTHYTVSYARNNAIGTATVTVTGRAPYCEGSASATFTIVDPAKGNDLSNVNKTVVTLKPTQYEYTGKPITPTFTVRYNGVRLIQNTDFTVELKQNINGGTGVLVIHGAGDYYGSFVATFTIVGGGAGAGDTPGSSSSGSGSSAVIPSPVVTSTETIKGDGVTTIVKTDSTGAMIAQSTYDDGTKVIADIPVIGPVTAVVTVPARVDTVTVTIPTRGEPTPGQVAVLLHPDGTEEIVKTSLPTEDGLELTLDASATVQIVDNAKAFVDVPANSWAKDAIDFVTSREIFNGTGNSTFTPSGGMSRAMVCTVLANLAGEDTKGGATWYGKAVDWAQQSGISDGTVPDAIVTREQLAAMLYRYAGSPVVLNEVPRRFRDRNSVSDWAEVAVTWAVENDLIRGRSSLDGLDLAPQATASRAEVAAVFQRYVALLK